MKSKQFPVFHLGNAAGQRQMTCCCHQSNASAHHNLGTSCQSVSKIPIDKHEEPTCHLPLQFSAFAKNENVSGTCWPCHVA
jgi:hypothetical protein